MTIPKMTTRQRSALFYIHRYETADFGVIIPTVTAASLLRQGLAQEGVRRKFARETGICLRLTNAGYKVIRQIEGTWK